MNRLRREEIRQFIETHHVVTVGQLTELLPDVSLMTIHRDLNVLQEQGLIEKIRGGARYVTGSQGEAVFAAREIVAKEAKGAIAEKALSLLSDAGSVFIDAGTTMMAFAKLFPDKRVSVVTTGPNIALELATRQKPEVTLCGGTLNKSNLTLSGAAALHTVEGLNIDTAFLTPSGYSSRSGFSCGMEGEARIKELALSKANKVVLLMDSSKVDRVLPYTFATGGDIHYLVTERQPAEIRPLFGDHPDLTIL